MKQENQALRQRLQALARAYVPEWRFDPQTPDPGSVAALLLEEMLADSEKRFGDVLRMHKIHYLNLFDRLRPDPTLSARSYVCFEPVTGADQAVYVPRGTALLAENDQGGSSLMFETTEGISASPAHLNTIVATQRDGERIVTVLDGENADRCVFTAFDPEPDSESHHILTLEFDRGLGRLGAGELGLKVSVPAPQEAAVAAERLAGPEVTFFLPGQGEEPDRILPRPRVEEDTLWFALEEDWLHPDAGEGISRYRLCARAQTALDLNLSGVSLVFSRRDILPEEVRCADITQSPGRFYPFGSPLELYAECGIECAAALERPGADVTMEFDLDFETLEQTLPEVEVEIDYKVIMKKVTQAPRPEMREVQPDYVLIEYLSTRGWKRLLQEEHATVLFNGSAQGHVALNFPCPADLLPADQMSGGCRLRLRLMRADGLYRLPCRQHVPLITGLRFSYSYQAAPLEPCGAYTLNNFVRQELLELWRHGRSAPLFTCSERQGACLYLGFDACPQGSPLSLYFEVENNEDQPLDYGVEYLGPGGFVPVQAQDGTGGLLYSGALMALVPGDAARKSLYGKDRYWLRLVCGELGERAGLPVVHGITMNMARVENRSTRTEEFYVDDPQAAVRFKLGENNILSARVYVNEARADHPRSDHWVLWQRRTVAAQRGRFYELDAVSGAVLFDRHTFSVYAPPDGAPAVRVEYQSYQGSRGNVPAGAIRTMAQPIRYISHVTNPMAAYGGTDIGDEAAAARGVSSLLRTRGRAVSERDYFDIIAQLGCGVRQIKCCSGIDRQGNPAADTITVALLIEEYEKGSHIFSAVKDAVREALVTAGGMVPLGKTLVLCQPRFVRFSVRIWLGCRDMESVYEVQRRTEETIRRFLDPLQGGFDGRGWKIGSLPTPQQLLACLKMKDSTLHVERMAMVARSGGRDYAVDEDFLTRMNDPFVMAINGTHTVYVDLI